MLMSLFLLACSGTPDAEPTVEPAAAPVPKAQVTQAAVDGSVGIISIKNKTAEDPGAPVMGGFLANGSLTISDFANLSGIDGQVVVPVKSWGSANEVRDERIQRTFFEGEAHPELTFEFASVEGVPAGGLVVDKGVDVTVKGRLGMHGQTQDVTVPMRATTYAKGHTKLTTDAPFDVSIAAFGMGEQLQALITECGHASVEDTVQVTVDLTLTPAP